MQRMLVSETARRALLATVAVFAWEPAAAQLVPQAGTQSAAQIEEILVVGARLPRPVQDVVGTVDVISRDNLLDSFDDATYSTQTSARAFHTWYHDQIAGDATGSCRGERGHEHAEQVELFAYAQCRAAMVSARRRS